MTFFATDDRFHSHPKVVRMPRARRFAAVGLWVLAGSWSCANLTDGRIPGYLVDDWDATGEAADLCEVGLWRAVDHDYQFDNWAQWQETRAQVETKRRQHADRQKRYRDRANERRASDAVTRHSRVTRASRDGAVTPSPLSTKPKNNGTEPSSVERVTSQRSLETSEQRDASRDASRPEVDQLCEHLADRIEANGSRRPNVTQAWRDACRRMIDIDGRTPTQVSNAIDWCQADEFWRGNVLSMGKLREQYERLRLAAQRGQPQSRHQRETDDRFDRAMQRAEQRERQATP